MSQLLKKPKLVEMKDHPPKPDLDAIHRFIVINVDLDHGSQGVHLLLVSDLSSYKYKCRLTGMWFSTKIVVGDVVNIKTTDWHEDNGEFVITDTSGFIVVNPDNMIPCTSITSSLFCQRKSWLNEKFKGWGPASNKAMTTGILVHELLQLVCMKKIYDKKEVYAALKQMIESKQIISLAYDSSISESELMAEAEPYVPWMLEWVNKYITGGPSPLYEDTSGRKAKIIKIHDIEDNIWCHYYGLKGKVDISAEVVMSGGTNGHLNETRAVLPLELKSGKASFSSEHVAQATMYSLMMDNRQHGSCSSGLLLYLKDGPKMKEIILKTLPKHSLIQRRNDYDQFSRKWDEGPEFKDSMRSCVSCEHLLDCSLMAKCFEEEKIEESDVMSELIPNVTSHLNSKDLMFFAEWVTLLNQELMAEKELSNRSQTVDIPFWNESSISREEESKSCLAKMVIVKQDEKIYRFERSKDFVASLPQLSLTVSNWKIRERIALSLDEDQLSQGSKRDMIAIMTGYLNGISSDYIECSFDKDIQPSLINMTFRIDLLGVSSYGFAVNFSMILRLMAPEDKMSSDLRNVIINGQKMTFNQLMPANTVIIQKSILKNLSKDQKKIVIRILASDKYLLMKESSESSEAKIKIITGVIQMLVQMQKSCLIVTQSMQSLDDILVSIVGVGVDKFLRIGAKIKCCEELLTKCEEDLMTKIKTVKEMAKFYDDQRIIGTTINRITGHPCFEARKDGFDYCIIDESSQMILSTCLAPLFRSTKFILIGKEGKEPTVKNLSQDGSAKCYSLFSHLSKFNDNVYTC